MVMSHERYKIWQDQLAEIDELEHLEGCYNGFVMVADETGHPLARKCPICRARRDLEALQQKVVAAGIGERYTATSWGALQLVAPMDALAKRCQSLADLLPGGVAAGQNVLFYGEPGTGKTQSAVLFAKRAIELGRSALVANIGRIAVEVRSGYDSDNGLTEEQAVRNLATPDLLVLDDLGAGEAEKGTLEMRMLYLALEERCNNKRPTIVTSNLNPTQLLGFLGGRVMNRLMPLTEVRFAHKTNFRLLASKGFWS